MRRPNLPKRSSSRWSCRLAAFDGVLLAGRTVQRWDSKNGDGEHRQIKPLTRFSARLGLTRADKASVDSFPLTSFLFMLDWILFCTCSQNGNCFFAWSRPQRHPANLLPGNHLTLPLPAPASLPSRGGRPCAAPTFPGDGHGGRRSRR
jgi:hypothetical protein